MTRENLPALSPSETEILRLVWQLDKATVQEVCKKLPAKRKIGYATVQTLLRRLEKKGYIKHKNLGRAHQFYPVVESQVVIKTIVTDFLDKLFDGEAIPLIQYLAKHDKITTDDIEKLKKLIAEKK